MNIVPPRWSNRSVSLMLFAALSGCVVTGAGYDADVGFSEDVGISFIQGVFQPYDYDYGGWVPGYHVGPPHRGEPRHEGSPHEDDRGPRQSSHPEPSRQPYQPGPQSRPSPQPTRPGPSPRRYQPAPPSKATPSIPTRPRAH